MEQDLRVHATISDFYLDLRLGLDNEQLDDFARLLDQAADRVERRGTFTAQEAASWVVLDDLCVTFRGTQPYPAASSAELGRAVADLIRGTLQVPPAGAHWLYGAPGGRRTIAAQDGL